MARTPTEHRLTAKGAQTREAIVVTAARLIYVGGVAGTSLEDVRTAAGVSNSQLYHYFTDKSALIQAVVRHQSEAVLGSAEDDLANLRSLAGLRAWRDAVVQNHARTRGAGGCPLGSLVGELADTDDGARQELASGFRQWNAHIEQGLDAMRTAGVLRGDTDPQALSLVLLAALQGGLLLSQAEHTLGPLEIALDGAIDYIASFGTDRS